MAKIPALITMTGNIALSYSMGGDDQRHQAEYS
jgi:hypothetical protein